MKHVCMFLLQVCVLLCRFNMKKRYDDGNSSLCRLSKNTANYLILAKVLDLFLDTQNI